MEDSTRKRYDLTLHKDYARMLIYRTDYPDTDITFLPWWIDVALEYFAPVYEGEYPNACEILRTRIETNLSRKKVGDKYGVTADSVRAIEHKFIRFCHMSDLYVFLKKMIRPREYNPISKTFSVSEVIDEFTLVREGRHYPTYDIPPISDECTFQDAMVQYNKKNIAMLKNFCNVMAKKDPDFYSKTEVTLPY